MSGTLDGRRALVTGAASGIGRAAFRALQAEGASVVGIDLRHPADAPGEIVVADIASEAEVIAAVATAVRRLGGIDIVVNSAGIEIEAPLAAFAVADFDRMYAVNVRGTALVTREALRHMGDGGRIVNLASELAHLGRAGASGYCATKGAILSMTRAWARELGPGILVNAVAPGPTDTPLLHFATMTPELQALEISNPLGRIGRPEEIAAAIVFLASPGASFMTGHCIGVDGGAAMR
jgi:3-oxoacyl-[acyl-carrier protein] reductase